jgi:lipopolysaccharide assembly protein A
MLRLIRLLLGVALLLVIIFLAVANRHPVDISFWPLPYELSLPLFVVALLCLILGAVLAGLFSWVTGWSRRMQAYRDHRRVVALEARERLRQEQAERSEIERQRERRNSLALASQAR